MELSKKDKKTAREIIEKGLQTEYVKGLKRFDSILQQWKNKTIDNREAYMQLYESVRKHDKHIARRYDGMTGSKYLMIIAAQLADGILTDADLENFSDEVKQLIKLWSEG
ncbi:MAG TPA: hypothetical protein PLB59_10535 [Bacteroidales bacterium]|jgi:hypothetical protein|nr:hypothetical protein [Bacteroidales bacterium]HPI30066.1 hypothetical protein [Bacteroidales bacterium]HQN16784.1 hypothetical protein [Bacteroidales bacterium]HQP16390.1 hypothetical protein [Bacteroidales bacterium]